MKQMKPLKENNLFFAMGVVVALSILLAAFEWSSMRSAPKIYSSEVSVPEELVIDLTRRTPEPPKPQIEPPQVVAPDEIMIVDDPVEHQAIFFSEDAAEPPQVVYTQPTPRLVEEAVESAIDFAEIAPHFIGGQTALMKFLGENMRYPQVDIDMGNEGRVICTFVVEKDGSITDIKVIRGVSPTIDREAVRVISEMPNWKPGFQNGRMVRVKFTLPVYFKITK
ncbi:MAG: TonB family protein [Bacteroidia bacterium]|nr:TonB family protein [Bacteroidia bacterium]